MVVMTLMVLMGTGCVPSREQYFGDIHRRRMRSFEDWRERRKRSGLEKPRLEGVLSLRDAVNITLAYNTQIQAVLQEKERARGRTVAAYSEALPKLNLSAGYTRLDEVPTLDVGVDTIEMGDEDNYSCRVEISQPLYKGGSMAIAQRAAQIYSYLSDENVRRSIEEAVFGGTKAYFDARLAQHLIKVQEAALQSAQQHLSDVKSRFEHGTATEYDVLRARVDVSNIRADLIEQRNARDKAVTRLMRMMGASQRSQVKLITDMKFVPVSPDFAESVEEAFANRPDIYQSELSLDLQREQLKEARSRYWPRIQAYFWNLWSKPDPHESNRIEWGDQWQAGVELNWPLFDGMAREGRIIEQKALLRQNQILLSDAEEQAIEEVREAMLELQNARKLVESQELNLERADRALELVQAGYKQGVNTEVEVLDGRAALTRARGLYYQALHRHTIARIVLQKAKGILGPPPGNTKEPEESVGPEQIMKIDPRIEEKSDGAEQ